MMSHSTVPTLSGLLLGHIHSLYVCKKTKGDCEHIETDDTDSENKLGSIKLELDKTGRLVENNHFLDYFYHDEKI